MLSSSCMLGTNHQLAVILRLCSSLGVRSLERCGLDLEWPPQTLSDAQSRVWRYLKGVEPVWSLTGGSGSLSGL